MSCRLRRMLVALAATAAGDPMVAVSVGGCGSSGRGGSEATAGAEERVAQRGGIG